MQSHNRRRDPGHAKTCGISYFRGSLEHVPAIFLSTRLPPENHTQPAKTLADAAAAAEDGGSVAPTPGSTERLHGFIPSRCAEKTFPVGLAGSVRFHCLILWIKSAAVCG